MDVRMDTGAGRMRREVFVRVRQGECVGGGRLVWVIKSG